MFILGTYVGIASTLFSAFVCWRCFTWRRRFPSAIFAVYGVVSAIALLWSGLSTLTETILVDDTMLLRSIGAFNASGELPSGAALDEFRLRIKAHKNSIILTNVAISFVVTAAAAVLAMVAFERLSQAAPAPRSS